MRFVNAKVVYPGYVEEGALAVENGFIAADSGAGEQVDCAGKYIIPGLIDIHVHGAGGADAMDGTADSLETFASTLLANGTTAFLPTTMSATFEAVLAALKNIARNKSCVAGAEILGVHMEGPVISVRYKGAQNEKTITPDGEGAQFIKAAAAAAPGLIKIATLAPERADAGLVVSACLESGIIASAGHTGADYSSMRRAIEEGVRSVTHSFNAMPGILHRSPGPLVAAFGDSRVNMEFIGDGVHLHPAVLEFALRNKGRQACLISDSLRAMGMPEGEYELGGQMITVQNGMALLPDKTIAGSAFPLLQGIRTLAGQGWPLYEAVAHASLYPAELLGVEERIGSLETGKEATFVILNEDLTVFEVWQRGNKVQIK